MDIISIIAYSIIAILVVFSLTIISVYTIHSRAIEWCSGLVYLRDKDMISDVDLERAVRNPPWYVSLSDRISIIQEKIGKSNE